MASSDMRRVEVLDDGNPPARAIREISRLPVLSGGPGRPGSKRVQTKAELHREYVTVGGVGSAAQSYGRTLPQYIDDVTRNFGKDLYRRMRHDSQVESALSTLIMATQAQGFHIGPNIEKGTEGYDESKSIADFCVRVVERLERPVSDIFYEMGMAVAYGYKVAEQTYEPVNWSQWNRPLMAISHLRTKPQDATAFVVDDYNNILGLTPMANAGKFLGRSEFGAADLFVGNPTSGDGPLLIPRSKFWIFSFLPENGDPRGTSLLRAAYHPWWVKGQVWKAYLQYLATFAQPSVVGFVSANREPDYLLDKNGDPIITQTPQEVMLTALQKIQNGAAGAFANDEKVQVLQASGNGETFQQAINITNREITKALIRQTLTTDEGEHMARAASEIHQDVFGLFVRHLKASMVGSFKRDVIMPLVWYNFGEDAVVNYLPDCTLGETEHQDFSTDATAVANLLRAGFFDESQYRALDDFLGLPPRDPETWARKLEMAEQILLTTMSGPNTGPGNPDGQKPVNGEAGEAGAEESAASQDTKRLTARLTAKSSAMKISNRLGTIGPS